MASKSPTSGVASRTPEVRAASPSFDKVKERFVSIAPEPHDRPSDGDDFGSRFSQSKTKLVNTSKETKVLEELYSNDGLSPGVFNFLWLIPSKGRDNQAVHIPQTVIFLNGTPVAWYFWSKQQTKVLRKKGENITTGNIIDVFTTRTGESPVIATYQMQELVSHDPTTDAQQAPRALSSVQYLNEAELGTLLVKGIRHRGVGILQKFVEPADKRVNTICATWSPQNCVIQRRTNKHRLLDSTVELSRKLVTWDGPEILSETVPLSGTVVTKRVESFCAQLVEHCFVASSGRFQIYRMSANFRTGTDGCLHFLGCTSLRLIDAGETPALMKLAINRAERGMDDEPAEPVPTTSSMNSTMCKDGSSRPASARSTTKRTKTVVTALVGGRLSPRPGPSPRPHPQQQDATTDSKGSRSRPHILPSWRGVSAREHATAVGSGHVTANKPGVEDQFVCVVTGNICSNKNRFEVSYLRLLEYWRVKLAEMAPAAQHVAERQVPVYIKRAQPEISISWYLKASKNAAWLAKTASVCQEAADEINALLQPVLHCPSKPARTGRLKGTGSAGCMPLVRRHSGNALQSTARQQAQQEAVAAASSAGAAVCEIGRPGSGLLLQQPHTAAEEPVRRYSAVRLGIECDEVEGVVYTTIRRRSSAQVQAQPQLGADSAAGTAQPAASATDMGISAAHRAASDGIYEDDGASNRCSEDGSAQHSAQECGEQQDDQEGEHATDAAWCTGKGQQDEEAGTQSNAVQQSNGRAAARKQHGPCSKTARKTEQPCEQMGSRAKGEHLLEQMKLAYAAPHIRRKKIKPAKP